MSEVLTSREGGVFTITLNRPDVFNAFNRDLHAALRGALEEAADPAVRAVVITGAGRGFCAGQDLREFSELQGSIGEALEATYHPTIRLVRGLEKPVLAAVNGPALAGGFALALLCDIRIASETATFGYPELPIGIPPSYASARAALSPAVARELCLTGRVIDAAEALRIGVVTEVCAPGELRERTTEVAEKIAGMPQSAQEETKRRILMDGKRSWGELFAEEGRVFREVLLGGEPDSAA